MAHNLSERAVLVTLNIRQWRAEVTDAAVGAEVCSSHGANSNAARVQKYLIDQSQLKVVRTVAGAARNNHYALTLPWDDTGRRIITTVGYLNYVKVMNNHMEVFNRAADEFVAAYPSLMADAPRFLGGMFDPNKYPDAREISGRFGFSIGILPVPDSQDVRVHLTDDAVNAIKQSIVDSTLSQTQSAMTDLAERVKTALGHMASKLASYSVTDKGVSGAFRDSLVENVRELADILPGLNLTGDPRIDTLAADMRAELGRFDADELRADESARKQVSESADDMLRRLNQYGL